MDGWRSNEVFGCVHKQVDGVWFGGQWFVMEREGDEVVVREYTAVSLNKEEEDYMKLGWLMKEGDRWISC